MTQTTIEKKWFLINLGTLITLIWLLFTIFSYANDFENRIIRIENSLNKWERFTAQDGKFLEEKIKQLAENKADKADMRVISTKLANIETMLVDLKTKVK